MLPKWDCAGRSTGILLCDLAFNEKPNFPPLQIVRGQMVALCRMSEFETESKMNKGFVAWAQYLEEWIIFHVALLKISSPSSQLGPKIISVRACVCDCHCVNLCAHTGLFFFFFKSATACRHLNLPTWQLAPLITNSNTHQWTSNEAFLWELWLAMGLQSIPQFWIAYYGLLRHSLIYTDKTVSLTSMETLEEFWCQANCLQETI